MTPIHDYLTKGKLPDNPKEAAVVRRRACSYILAEGKLYMRGFSIPLLKCIDQSWEDNVLLEIHEGISDQHLGGRSIARKALRVRYYWPTMQYDTKEHVRKCDKFQWQGDMHLAPPNELKSLSSSGPSSGGDWISSVHSWSEPIRTNI